ncbi:MAG: hypothetical protein JWO67_2294 [Streptosporangiaceae bacterium]|nr:hypothetical protein [Streptosporangiaceae bacterium]
MTAAPRPRRWTDTSRIGEITLGCSLALIGLSALALRRLSRWVDDEVTTAVTLP